MPINVINNNGGAQTLATLLKGVNDVVAHRSAATQNQAQLDRQAQQMAFERDKFNFTQDEALRNQSNLDRSYMHDRDVYKNVSLPQLVVNQGHLKVAQDGNTRAQQNHENVQTLFQESRQATPLPNGELPNKFDMLTFQRNILEGGTPLVQSNPLNAIQTRDLDAARATDLRSQAKHRGTDVANKANAAQALQTRIEVFKASPEGQAILKLQPGLEATLAEQLDDDGFAAYVSGVRDQMNAGTPISSLSRYNDRADARAAAVEAGQDPDEPMVPTDIREELLARKSGYSEAGQALKRIEKMREYVSTPGFGAGGFEAITKGLTQFQALLTRFAPEELTPAMVQKIAAEENYDMQQQQFMIGLAKQLYPVSNSDMIILNNMTGGRTNSVAGIWENLNNMERQERSVMHAAEQYSNDYLGVKSDPNRHWDELRMINGDRPGLEWEAPNLMDAQMSRLEDPTPIELDQLLSDPNMMLLDETEQFEYDVNQLKWVPRQ